MRNFSRPSPRFAWILLISALQLLGPIYATAGILPTGDFTPTYNGTDDPWNVGGDLYVGWTSPGELSIDGGSVVNVSKETVIGSTASAPGVVIFDQGTLNTGGLKASPGELRGVGTINSKGLVSDVDLAFNTVSDLQQQLVLTGLPDQNITINLDMSVPADNQDLGVGYRGTATLTIADGMTVDSQAGLLGYHPGSDGTAIITGVGSTWNSAHGLFVGHRGNGQLRIESGAHVSNSQAYIGNVSGSTGTATVTGAGSTWNNIGSILMIGRSGDGRLDIADGGIVNVDGTTWVGWSSSGTGVANFDGGTLNTKGLLASSNELLGTGTINTQGLVSDVDLTFDSTHGLLQQLALTGLPDQNITINLDISDRWTYRNLGVGYRGTGTLTIADAKMVYSSLGFLGRFQGSSGTATVTGALSTWSNSQTLYVGHSGHGELLIEDGGRVFSEESVVSYVEGSTGVVTITGVGSVWDMSGSLYVGLGPFSLTTGEGFLDILNGGMVKVEERLTISNDGDDSYINMTTGGKLALFGDADDSLTEFLDMISGSDALNYWNGTTWSDITNATFGLDYTLEYQNTGNLAGYTLLTVGTPGDFDGDRDVDGSDFLILQRGMGTLYGTSELEAWETNYGATPFSRPGDFNSDGGVDGSDFLAWQRGESPDPLSAADLASWESAYITAESALVAVPEPTSIMLVAIGVFGLLRQQRP